MVWFSFLVLPTLPAFAMPIGDKQLEVFRALQTSRQKFHGWLSMRGGYVCYLAYCVF